ncbi:MAG: hypothetical protein IH614_07825 [Desulfuromonadales bacterium]|nr:hypothetical protein [Desulfuromonadales bacterium]
MKKRSLRPLAIASLASLLALGATQAGAGTVSYTSPKHIFSTNDVMCDQNLIGTACLSPSLMLNEKDGGYYYGIDSAYGYRVQDFTVPVPVPRDGVYDNGMIIDVKDEFGVAKGVSTVTQITPRFLSGALKGEWAAGLGGLSVKASTEHYLVMDHVLNATWMPPLVQVKYDSMGQPMNIGDFSTRLKDDGKILFMWGNLNKKPTELRLFTQMPLPEAWKQPGANYQVTSAKLLVTHLISTSPNDQLRPEDFENESATGILPQYTICPTAPALAPQSCSGLPAGTWVSAVDSLEGDGHYIPAGTVLKTATSISFDHNGDGIADYVDAKTNAWYTTLDRDPFGGPNPRWRLKSSKYGQDLPGVELPQYPAGKLTTTVLDLLSVVNDQGQSILSQSANWNRYLDINPEKGDFVQDNFTADGAPLSPDFDLMVYIKGEYSGNELYDATLLVEYDDPQSQDPPPATSVDVAVDSLVMPKLRLNQSGLISVSLHNKLAGQANGVLNVEVKNATTGAILSTYSISFSTSGDQTVTTFTFPFTTPSIKTAVSAKATAVVDGDIDKTDNTKTVNIQYR